MTEFPVKTRLKINIFAYIYVGVPITTWNGIKTIKKLTNN